MNWSPESICGPLSVSATPSVTAMSSLRLPANGTVTAPFSSMAPALQKKIRDAFLALDASTPQGKEILELNRATRYIPTKADNYKGIETAARSAGLLK